MVKPIENSFYAASYQSLDSSNYSLAGIETKLKGDGKYVSSFIGGGTNFKDTNLNLVVDFKGGMNYDEKGITNQNLRLRTKLGENYQYLQVRYSPLSVNVPVGKNTNLYLNPHYVGQYTSDGKWTNSAGAFAGISQKIGDTTLSLEAQRYNLQDINNNSKKNWSLNAILSYKF